METRTFTYGGKQREVLVLRETESHIQGVDLNYLPEKDRQRWRDQYKDRDLSKMTEEEGKAEYAALKDLHAYYRNFLKSKMG